MKIMKRWTAWLMVCFMIIGLGYTDTRAQAAVEAGVTEEMALVNNVYVQEPMVEAPGTQRIIICFITALCGRLFVSIILTMKQNMK